MRLRTAVLLISMAAATSACGASRGDKVREAERTVRAEQTADKLLHRGKLFARVGDFTRASQYLNAALDAGAKREEVLPTLMRVYVVSGRFRTAIQLGEEELAQRPENHALRFLVGTMFSAIGREDLAREYFERVLLAQPKHAEAHYALAVLLRDGENDLVGADRHFREYLRLEPTGAHAEEARGSLLKDVP
ncbi:MAG: tetratricopeptide repeat protein [Myxococcales bacterium]|nr:tetratricopeptide repeat protein [Myxococcales bacterium]